MENQSSSYPEGFIFPTDANGQFDWSQFDGAFYEQVNDNSSQNWDQGPQVVDLGPEYTSLYQQSSTSGAHGTYSPNSVTYIQIEDGNDPGNSTPPGQYSMDSSQEYAASVQRAPRSYSNRGSASPPRRRHSPSTGEGSSSQPGIQFRPGLTRPSTLHLERLSRAADRRYSETAARVIGIMGDAQISLQDGQCIASNVALQQQVLGDYIESLSPDLHAWVCAYRPYITSTSHQERAKDKRKSGGSGRLYCCLWCSNTFTMKHNLANHVRSHLDLHISFCQGCDFSSVCSSLPTRHQCSK